MKKEKRKGRGKKRKKKSILLGEKNQTTLALITGLSTNFITHPSNMIN